MIIIFKDKIKELTNEELLLTTQEYQNLIEEINQKEERWLELCSKEQE